jgi:hypothetical protein
MGRGVKVAEQSRESDGLKKPSLEQVCSDAGNGRGEKGPNAINLCSSLVGCAMESYRIKTEDSST